MFLNFIFASIRSIFCFVIAGLIYNYFDNGMWRNIAIGFFVLGGFGAISEIFDKGKSKYYDTSKIQKFDTYQDEIEYLITH